MRINQLSRPELDRFFESILMLDDLEDCYEFFDDLMTLKEMQVVLRRFTVAQMLLEGKTYQEIEEKTQASTAIISRVKRSIEEGNQSYQRLARKKKLLIDKNLTKE